MDLVDEREIIVELSKALKGKELVEASVYLREVMLIPSYKGNIRKFLTDFLADGKIMVKSPLFDIHYYLEGNIHIWK